jgi:Putative RNase-like toxin, toxin_1
VEVLGGTERFFWLQRQAGNAAVGELLDQVQRCGGTHHEGCACTAGEDETGSRAAWAQRRTAGIPGPAAGGTQSPSQLTARSPYASIPDGRGGRADEGSRDAARASPLHLVTSKPLDSLTSAILASSGLAGTWAVTAPVQRDTGSNPLRGRFGDVDVKPFRAETSANGGVLTYREKRRIVLSASADAMRLMQGRLAGRLPFAYEFVPVPAEHWLESGGIAPRHFPIIRIVAGPGVSIRFESWPDFPFFSAENPMVQIYRVQDPAELPGPGAAIDPFRYTAGKAVDPAEHPGKTYLDQFKARVLTHPRSDGVDFSYHDPLHPQSAQNRLLFSVKAPNLLGNARFAYQVVPPKPGIYQPAVWTIKLVKTPGVEIKSWGEMEGNWDLMQEEIYEVASIADVPTQGTPITPVGRQVTSWEAQVTRKVNWGIVAFEAVISFIPIVGPLYNLAEAVYGVATGHDFWGQPLSSTDIAILGAGALLPFAGRGAKLAKNLAGAMRGLEGSEQLLRAATVVTDAQRVKIDAWEKLLRSGKEISVAEREAMANVLRELDEAVAKYGARTGGQVAAEGGRAAEIATVDGAHELKVTRKGVVRCSEECDLLARHYKAELDSSTKLKTEWAELKNALTANPTDAASLARLRQLEADLRVIRHVSVLQNAYRYQLASNQSLEMNLKNVAKKLKADPKDAEALAKLTDIESKLSPVRTAAEEAFVKSHAGPPGTVAVNALTPREAGLAQEIAAKTNSRFVGAPREGFAGIDGWLDGHAVQLKETQGRPVAVLHLAAQAVDKAENAARNGVQLYVKAANVTEAELLKFASAPDSPLSKIPAQGTISVIVVYAKDGIVVLK